MGFLVPIFMLLAFIFVWFGLTKFILALDRFFMRRALMRSERLDVKSMEALIQLCFGGNIFFRSRWFPKRSPQGTVYEEIPCILVFGKKIFVLEICSLPGQIHNTTDEAWVVTPPKEYARKKDIVIKNPILLARERAAFLEEFWGKVGFSADVTVEAMTIFTDKAHRLDDPEQNGAYTVNKALAYLSRFAPKTKPARRRIKRANQAVFGVFRRYSLSKERAIAKNNKIRRKKQ